MNLHMNYHDYDDLLYTMTIIKTIIYNIKMISDKLNDNYKNDYIQY